MEVLYQLSYPGAPQDCSGREESHGNAQCSSAADRSMAHYLVTARPHRERLDELQRQLEDDAFSGLRPFGATVTESLRGARWKSSESAVWEEEDYCSPPLALERAAVLDQYFDGIEVEAVARGEGWARIEALPRMFPGLQTA